LPNYSNGGSGNHLGNTEARPVNPGNFSRPQSATKGYNHINHINNNGHGEKYQHYAPSSVPQAR
jgi:hypothetical protein